MVETTTPPVATAGQDKPEWIDAKRATRLFGLSKTTLLLFAREGKIKTWTNRRRGAIRGRRLYHYDSLVEFFEKGAEGGAN